jgi:hypothetical protein
MAAQSLGGVVDASLKVYGTSNLRVVDASIMPLQIGAHLQSTVYAISEKVRTFPCYVGRPLMYTSRRPTSSRPSRDDSDGRYELEKPPRLTLISYIYVDFDSLHYLRLLILCYTELWTRYTSIDDHTNLHPASGI